MPTKSKAMVKKMVRKSKAMVKNRDRVFTRAKSKLGALTFGDIGNLMQLLQNYQGQIPAGFSRKGCHACIVKSM